MGQYRVIPLSYDTLNHVSAFTSERCPEGGMVAIADNTLRIIKVEKLGDMFTHM
jgi:splicing factor 3B subunit 3